MSNMNVNMIGMIKIKSDFAIFAFCVAFRDILCAAGHPNRREAGFRQTARKSACKHHKPPKARAPIA